MNELVTAFLTDRKTKWLKPKIKSDTSNEEVLHYEQDASIRFSPDNWIPSAAKRAAQLSLSTHPGKFSHPSARVSSIVANAKSAPDGFLRSGNCDVPSDAFGNAAALDVYEFLNLKVADGMTLLQHIAAGSSLAKECLAINGESFENLRQKFLMIIGTGDSSITSEKVKQIYFPVKDNYHLLSILTSSSIVFELKRRIKTIQFSDDTKEAREARRKGEVHSKGFSELFDLSQIGYGGSQPRNISVLNNKNGGRAYLLPSFPPQLEKSKVRIPKYNFFENIRLDIDLRNSFLCLHRLLQIDFNNHKIRHSIVLSLEEIISRIVQIQWAVRGTPSGWSKEFAYLKLPLSQKMWLDNMYLDERDRTDGWLVEIVSDMARWIIRTYRKVHLKQALMLGDSELSFVEAVVEQNREAFQ